MVNTIAVVAGGAADSLRNVYLILRGREFLAPDRVIPSILPIGGRVAFAPWVFSPHAEGHILCVGLALTCVPSFDGGTHVAADCFTIPRTGGGTGSRLLRAHGAGTPAGIHLELSARPGLPFTRVPSSLSRGTGSHLGRGGVGPGREHVQWKPCQRSRPPGRLPQPLLPRGVRTGPLLPGVPDHLRNGSRSGAPRAPVWRDDPTQWTRARLSWRRVAPVLHVRGRRAGGHRPGHIPEAQRYAVHPRRHDALRAPAPSVTPTVYGSGGNRTREQGDGKP